MNVLSLFDGMSCGRIALDRAGITVDNYFASEVDKHAIKVAIKNYPSTIQLGGVENVAGFMLPSIDLLIGGSPCQGFSFAGKQLAFDDPRSKLFFEYVRLLRELKPKYFLLENVRMKKEHLDVITEHLGVEPIRINSALVSAQNRVRYYWTNIPNVKQPEDRGLVLSDILECGFTEREKSLCVLSRVAGATAKGHIEKNRHQMICKVPVIKSHGELTYRPHKSPCLNANYHKGADNHGQRTGCIELGHADIKGHDVIKRVYSTDGKSPTLTAVCGGNQERKIAVDHKHWRKLTPIECERLQTVPDNYTEGVSKTQRYKMLGNGWTVDVIAHIFRGLR